MPHGGARLVDDRVPCEKHPARPLLVLAHRHVVAKRIGLPYLAWDRGVDVREERLLEAQLGDAAQSLDAWLRPIHEIEEELLRRGRVLVRELASVYACDAVAFERAH